MEWCNLRLNGIGYYAVFIPLLNRLVDIDYPYISDYPSYCIVNLGALAQCDSPNLSMPALLADGQVVEYLQTEREEVG